MAAGLVLPVHGARAAAPTVGVLTEHAPLAAIFAQGLSDAAWGVGRDVVVVRRGAGSDAWRSAVRELGALPARVIVAGSHAAARAAHEATDVIPIVAIDLEHDPIVSGFARTLQRPGGNMSGLFCDFDDSMRRLLQAVHDAVPVATRMVALTDGQTTEAQARAFGEAARMQGVPADMLALSAGSADALVDGVASRRAVLIVLSSPRLIAEAPRLIKRAARRKLATAGAFVRYAHAGGLLARGPSVADAFRRAAAIVDRVLRGARVADVAIERPPRYELVVNARTAATLEITLPASLLSTADHVIR